MGRNALRLGICAAALAIGSALILATFRFSLSLWLLPLGIAVFLAGSLGSERVVPLTVAERREKNKEILKEGVNLEQLGFRGFMLQTFFQVLGAMSAVLGLMWLAGEMPAHVSLLLVLVAIGILTFAGIAGGAPCYWLARERARRLRNFTHDADGDFGQSSTSS